MYRFGLIGRLTSAVAGRISRDVEAGISPEDIVPEEAARALVLMTERYLIDAFGSPGARRNRDDGGVVLTLQSVWTATLYGGGR